MTDVLPVAAGGVLVAAGAAVASLGPKRLLTDIGAPARLPAKITVVAAVMGLGVYAVGLAAGEPAIGCALGVLAAVLAVIFVIDLRTLTIPDLSVLMIASLALIGPIRSAPAALIVGAAVGAGLLWGVRWAFQRWRGVEALGLGDVKLMGAIGALAGPQIVLWIIVAGALLGVAWAAVRRGRLVEGAIPFGAAAAGPAFLLIGWDRLAG